MGENFTKYQIKRKWILLAQSPAKKMKRELSPDNGQ
jgi:hypothetical protein